MKKKTLFIFVLIVLILSTTVAAFASGPVNVSCDGAKVQSYSSEKGKAHYNIWVTGMANPESDDFNVNLGFTKVFHWNPANGQVNYLVEVRLPDGSFIWDAGLMTCS